LVLQEYFDIINKEKYWLYLIEVMINRKRKDEEEEIMSNPVLSDSIFKKYGRTNSQTMNPGEYVTSDPKTTIAYGSYAETADPTTMTISGSIRSTVILTVILIGTALANAYYYFNVNPDMSMKISFGCAIAALVVALVLNFKQSLALPLSILYALLEGVTIGGLSAAYSYLYNGIVIQAVMVTVTVLVLMLALYKFRIIKVTARFRSIITSAIMAVMLLYLGSFILSFFGVAVPFLQGTSAIAIGINVIIAGVASFSLLLDFDFIEKGSAQNLPKYFNWYAGFGLLVTLVWLYLEVLRLLSKIKQK